ncbi:MAG: patatin-like phospholipase family protein [Lysobacterales bacterium]
MPKIGLAVAGGGPLGGMYELGALRALDEALGGLELTDLDVYVGVSSGAFLAGGLASGIPTAEMCRIFLTNDSQHARFRPESFLRPAFGEYARRLFALPRVITGWLGDLITKPIDTDWSDIVGRLGTLVPNGIFDNAAIECFLRDVFTKHGLGNDFRKLRHPLYVIGVDLDTGNTVRFGGSGFDHVPISKAVQASSALPGLYPPVEIDGRYYVDGALRRTMHASVAFEAGADLVIAVNPLVPFDANLATLNGRPVPENLVEGGLPAVLSQTFRTMLRSRMQVGLEKYQRQYPAADMVLLEPNPDDVEMFFTNVFSYQNRVRVAEHAYQATLDDLRRNASRMAPLLARHGLALRADVINDSDRSLMQSLGLKPPRQTEASARLRRALDRLDHNLSTRH